MRRYSQKATEGIVFTFNGNTYKLTGLFTPINRLRGFFEYGSARLPQMYSDEMNEVIIRAARRFLLEGGYAFKDSSGERVTSPDRIPRDIAERVIAGLKANVFDGLNMSVGRGGSTQVYHERPKQMLGDIDLIIHSDDETVQKLIDSTASGVAEFRDPGVIVIPTLDKTASEDEEASEKAPAIKEK